MQDKTPVGPELITQTFDDLDTREIEEGSLFELLKHENDGWCVRVMGAAAVGHAQERVIGVAGPAVVPKTDVSAGPPEPAPWWALPDIDNANDEGRPYTAGNVAHEFLKHTTEPEELEALLTAMCTHGVEPERAQVVADRFADQMILATPVDRQKLLQQLADGQRDSTSEAGNMRQRMVRAMNIRTRMAMRLADTPKEREKIDYDTLVEQLDSNGLFDVSVFNSVACMVWPGVSKALAQRLSNGENIFADLSVYNRSQSSRMAGPYLLQLLSRIETLPDRHQENATKLKEVLFPAAKQQELIIRNLLHVANRVTTLANEGREGNRRQSPLPVGSTGLTDVLGCGEAVFRIIHATALKPEHIEEDRAFAEVMDAILQPMYQRAHRHQPVTVADICARYPDVSDEGIVLRLREAATHNGFSAASRAYQEALGAHGRAVYFRRNRPGAGIVS